ncbi:MAG TPA: ATP-binding protein [Vicinamibacterales bacterium]|nr:ATP-binding protein [Vicinamibacterales bacterium]
MTLPIRARLTLWYVGLLAIVLIGFSAGVLWLQNRFSRAQLDQELAALASAAGGTMQEELRERGDLARAARDARESFATPNRTVAIIDASGRVLAARWRGFRRDSAPPFDGRPLVATVVQDGLPWRLHMRRDASSGGAFTILVAASENPITHARHVLVKSLLIGAPLALLVSATVAWWAASRALRPLTAMSEEAERITVQSLGQELPCPTADDEIGQLGRAFNHLLQRVASAVDSQRQFMADASHELRTPVSAARTAADVMLARPHRREREYREALSIILTQTRRLGGMVDDMLALARADVGGYRVRLQPCELDRVLAECADTARLLAKPKRVTVDARLQPAVRISGDPTLVRQLALNVLENAITHTPTSGVVRLSMRSRGDSAEIEIADSGSGIPEAERERIFERFVRLDTARESSGGAGLGLPIARWIAEAHGGTLTLAATGPAGSTFVARLPIR